MYQNKEYFVLPQALLTLTSSGGGVTNKKITWNCLGFYNEEYLQKPWTPYTVYRETQ